MKTLSLSILLLAVIISTLHTPASAQWDGYIDFEMSIDRQIARLEGMVGGDSAAYKQVVMYQWLIQLYTMRNQLDEVESCYERILAFYPGDVNTLNAYAVFLIVHRGDLEKAEQTLHDAHLWAKARDDRSLEIGTTLQLRADLMLQIEEPDRALAYAQKGLEYMGEYASPPLLRTLGRAYRNLDRFDEAGVVFLRLIALESGVNRDDINELKLFIDKTSTYKAEELNKLIAQAIDLEDGERRQNIKDQGGEVIELQTEDGVLLEGTLRRTDGKGAVLFVHDLGARREVYTPYEQLFFVDDITTLSIDLRGHGASRADSLLSYAEMSNLNQDQTTEDVTAAMDYLYDLGYENDKITIVAEGYACGVVEKAMYRSRISPPVVYLSPTFDELDLDLHTAFSFHTDRPTLVIFGNEDLSAMKSVQMFRETKDFSLLEQKMYERAGHGVDALRRVPKALTFFQAWVGRVLADE
jgi:tetratricopeptide (TPR) repeat protein